MSGREQQSSLGFDDRISHHDKRLRQYKLAIFILLFSVVSYYCISRYVVTAVVVQGRSMVPTLNDGERYLLNRWSLLFREPKRGDLVVVQDAGHSDFAVKRIIALPGERLELRKGRVWINGSPAFEPYLAPDVKTYSSGWPEYGCQVGAEEYFVLGDNRSRSEDSRTYGPLRREQIIGLLMK